MGNMTEEELLDRYGEARIRRRIESARAMIAHADGTTAQYPDCSAEEIVPDVPRIPAQWRLLGIPVTVLTRTLGMAVRIEDVRFLAGNGATILRLVEVTLGAQVSQWGRDYLIGTEAPLEGGPT